MQPKSKIKYDQKSLEVLQNTMQNICTTHRERKKSTIYSTDLPEVLAIKLTNRCNLRCKHCYQWNADGYHTFLKAEIQKKDISIKLVQKILKGITHDKNF